jgi:hypothetical protein
MELHDKGTDRLLADIAAAPLPDMTFAEAHAALSVLTPYYTITVTDSWETRTTRMTRYQVVGCVDNQPVQLVHAATLREAVESWLRAIAPPRHVDPAVLDAQLGRA